MNATLKNGQARKSLAEQIDRLDRTLDGLADGLQEAVAAAVQQAVRCVLAELLSNAEFQARLQAARCVTVETAAQTATPSTVRVVVQRVWRWLGRCRQVGADAIRNGVSSVIQRVRDSANRATACLGLGWKTMSRGCRSGWEWFRNHGVCVALRARDFAGIVWETVKFTRHVAVPLLTSLIVGGLICVAAFNASPWVAALASGTSSFASTLGIFLLFGLRGTPPHNGERP
jgi:hypothetical protein